MVIESFFIGNGAFTSLKIDKKNVKWDFTNKGYNEFNGGISTIMAPLTLQWCHATSWQAL